MNINLFVLTRDLIRIGLIDTFTSLIWKNNYTKAGEFTLVLPYTDYFLNLIKIDNIIYRSDAAEAAIIEAISIDAIDNITTITIHGRFLPILFNRRINKYIKNYNNTAAGAVISDLINSNCINQSNRSLPNMAAINSDLGVSITLQDSYSNIYDKVVELCNSYNLGIKCKIDLENKKILPELYQGQDLTQKIIISENFENVLNENYYRDQTEFKNFAFIGGQGEGTSRVITTTGGGSGFDLYETFIDARDVDKGEDITESQYIELLKTRGKDKLSTMTAAEVFEGGINLQSNVKYKYNFNLGDKITYISTKTGIKASLIITSVEEVFEGGEVLINVEFGQPALKLSDKIKNMIGGK